MNTWLYWLMVLLWLVSIVVLFFFVETAFLLSGYSPELMHAHSVESSQAWLNTYILRKCMLLGINVHAIATTIAFFRQRKQAARGSRWVYTTLFIMAIMSALAFLLITFIAFSVPHRVC